MRTEKIEKVYGALTASPRTVAVIANLTGLSRTTIRGAIKHLMRDKKNGVHCEFNSEPTDPRFSVGRGNPTKRYFTYWREG